MQSENISQGFEIRIKNWWKDVPLFSKFIFIISVFTSIYFFIPIIFLYLELCYHPGLVFSSLKLWQFFTFPYISLGPFTAVYSLCSYMPLCSKREKALGTFRFFLYFVTKNFLIAFVYTPLFFGVYSTFEYPEYYFYFYYISSYLSGLYPAIIVEMILVYNENGDDLSDFLCFPFKLKRKYHPWAFCLISFFFFGAFLKLLAGIIVGFLCKLYLDLYGYMKWSEVSGSEAKKWEGRLCMNLTSSNSFVHVNESGSEMPEIFPNNISDAQIIVPDGDYVPLPGEPMVPYNDELEILDEDENQEKNLP